MPSKTTDHMYIPTINTASLRRILGLMVFGPQRVVREFIELVGPKIIENVPLKSSDEFLDYMLTNSYVFLPAPVQLVISQDVWAKALISNKDSIIALFVRKLNQDG